jgi:hypothetical protein
VVLLLFKALDLLLQLVLNMFEILIALDHGAKMEGEVVVDDVLNRIGESNLWIEDLDLLRG